MNPAAPVRGLVHTDVLLDLREGWPLPLQFFTDLLSVRRPEFTALSAMQLVANCQTPGDRASLRNFFSGCDVYPIGAVVARRAQRLIESLTPPCGLNPDDAISAVVALQHSLLLYTLDPGRFAAVPGLNALRPY